MGVATRGRVVIVFLMIITLGLSLGLPAEDIPETAYDESEAPPYEAIPVFSIAVPLVAARATQALLSCLHLSPRALSLFAHSGVRHADVHRSADARAVSALFCILLC